MKQLSHTIIRAFVALLTLSIFAGWGSIGHKLVNGTGGEAFPDKTIVSPSILKHLIDSASVPDYRSGLEPKHYMDIDELSEYFTNTIPLDLTVLFAKYGETRMRTSIGILPWVIDSVTTALTEQMRSHQWNTVWCTATDLGHYIADAHQPLHATKYYNGNTTLYGSGSTGIHSRYETELLKRYQSSIVLESVSPTYIEQPLIASLQTMIESCSYADSILRADYEARQVTNNTINDTYYSLLWQKVGTQTIRQLQRASYFYASFLLTAWVNAGCPSTFVEHSQTHLKDFTLFQNYPNPFNASTVIRYSISDMSTVTLKVYDLFGRQITTLVNAQQPAGMYSIPFINTSLSSGIYVYTIEVSSCASGVTRKETKKMSLLR